MPDDPASAPRRLFRPAGRSSASGRTSSSAKQPSDEELAALDPDLHAALFGSARPAVLGHAGVPAASTATGYDEALAQAPRRRPSIREVGSGDPRRHRARFFSSDAAALRDLYLLVGDLPQTDVLLDDRPVPFARELWLPLLWLLLLR